MNMSTSLLAPGGERHHEPFVYMAPNYVYPMGDTDCMTNHLTPTVLSACGSRPSVCLDAINRGQLSGLQPPVMDGETVFDTETSWITKYFADRSMDSNTAILENLNVAQPLHFSANGQTFVLRQGQTVAIGSPRTRVVVTDGAGTVLHVGALTPFSSPETVVEGHLQLKSSRQLRGATPIYLYSVSVSFVPDPALEGRAQLMNYDVENPLSFHVDNTTFHVKSEVKTLTKGQSTVVPVPTGSVVVIDHKTGNTLTMPALTRTSDAAGSVQQGGLVLQGERHFLGNEALYKYVVRVHHA